MIKVEKKDGRIVEFDGSKIASALGRVGLEQVEAEKVASQVEAWAETAAVDGIIKASAIGEKVLELIPPEAVEEYKSFKKEKK